MYVQAQGAIREDEIEPGLCFHPHWGKINPPPLKMKSLIFIYLLQFRLNFNALTAEHKSK